MTLADMTDALVKEGRDHFWKVYQDLMKLAAEGGRTPGIAAPSRDRLRKIWNQATPYDRQQLLYEYPDEFADFADEEGYGDIKQETETELDVEVAHPEMLKARDGHVWKFLQAHEAEGAGEETARVIPATRQAFIRHKTPAMGFSRYKIHHEVPYQHGVQELKRIGRVAVKNRFFVTYRNHTWVISHFPETNEWVAETNIASSKDLQDVLDHLPPWAGRILVDSPAGYTTSRAKFRGPGEIDSLMDEAMSGTNETYSPTYAKNPGGS